MQIGLRSLPFVPMPNLVASSHPVNLPGLELDPANDACKKGMQDAQKAQAASSNPFAKIFGPDVWVKIQMNPKLAPFLEQPDYVNMIKMMQSNPQAVNMYALLQKCRSVS